MTFAVRKVSVSRKIAINRCSFFCSFVVQPSLAFKEAISNRKDFCAKDKFFLKF